MNPATEPEAKGDCRPTPTLEIQNLRVRLGRREVLKNISVSLAGRTIGLLGPNGAGKTTLIHTLLGFHSPQGGQASLIGLNIHHEQQTIRALTGYMPENESFIPAYTPVRFLALLAELSGLPREVALERAHEALFFVGLGENRYRKLETLSVGLKQRVKLAQALVHGPRLILLDEPTNGLDPPARRRMIQLIKRITRKKRVQLILSSHLLRDVEECCEEVVILKEGRIAIHCNLEERRERHQRFVEFETRGNVESFIGRLEQLGCDWARYGDQRFKMVIPERLGARDIYAVAAETRVQLRRFDFKRDSLEDIFLEAMGS